MLMPNGDVAALIKPQFEAGREQVGKRVSFDRKVHEAVVEMIVDFAIKEGYDVEGLTFSPITGGDGNIEFLIHLKWHGERENGENHSPVSVEQVVTEAHDVLKQKGKGNNICCSSFCNCIMIVKQLCTSNEL